MSDTGVLLCGGTGLGLEVFDSAPTAVIDGLCDRPADAAVALRKLTTTRVVLVLCERRLSRELLHALRRAGASTFGIESVVVGGRSDAEAALLVKAAVARLDALAPGDNGKPALAATGLSRRALLQLAPIMTHSPVAVIDDRACVGAARCGLCAEACPEQAISPTGTLPQVDSAACTACGACVPRCPHRALRLAGTSTAQIEAQLESLLPWVTGVVLACRAATAEASAGWAVVELPTLGIVSPGWLLQLQARGTQVRLAPCEGACCSKVRRVEALAGQVIAAVGSASRITQAPVRLGEPEATADAVRRLATNDMAFVLEDASSPLGAVTAVAERCTLCGACSTACPTNALQLVHGIAETALRHQPSTCVGCGRCVTACPENALSVTPTIDVGGLNRGTVELAGAPHETCATCGTDLPPLPMRQRLRQLLPALSTAPSDLCAACAANRPAYDRVPAPSQRSN